MTETQAKVIARNRLNTQVNELAPVILEVLKPFVNTKITLQTGGFAAKIKSVLDCYLGSNKIFPKLQICNNNSRYSLSFVFQTSEQVGEYNCIYQEQTVYFGSMEGHALKELMPNFAPFKTDYNFEEIIALRNEYQKASQIKNDIENKLILFGVC